MQQMTFNREKRMTRFCLLALLKEGLLGFYINVASRLPKQGDMKNEAQTIDILL
jgi:hypothetical protein